MGNVFTCSFCFVDEAGVAQLVERQPGLGTKLIIWRALGPEAAGSNPAPGTTVLFHLIRGGEIAVVIA
jgi:hypothetical protein